MKKVYAIAIHYGSDMSFIKHNTLEHGSFNSETSVWFETSSEAQIWLFADHIHVERVLSIQVLFVPKF